MGLLETKEPRVSVVIPVYLTGLEDLAFLERALGSLAIQNHVPYQVVVSIDYCFDYEAMNQLFLDFRQNLDIEVFHNTNENGISSNSNNGLLKAKGDLVHVLHQDDSLASPNVYSEIANLSLSQGCKSFLLTAQRLDRVYTPVFDITALVGNNRFGGPSGLIFSNSNDLFFDTKLSMLCDVDFVFEIIRKFGYPKTIQAISINYGVSDGQAQNQIVAFEFENEVRYILKKLQVTPLRIFLAMLKSRQFSQYFAITEILIKVAEERYLRFILKSALFIFKVFLFLRRSTIYKL